MDIRNESLIKTIRLEGVRKVGDPYEFAVRYDAEGIDELYYGDSVASLYDRDSLGGLVELTCNDVFCPLTVGGGVRSTEDVRGLLRTGADKVAANTALVGNPALIGEIAEKFGSQVLTLQLDAKRKNGSWEAYCEGGRQPTGRNALEWAEEAVGRGAGEILVTSIDREGTRAGFDLDLIGAVSSLPVPVVASGGFGAALHAVEAWQVGASGIAIAGDLHYNRTSLVEIREALMHAGAAVRMI